jgi:probable HAF family extracellular repeat protein
MSDLGTIGGRNAVGEWINEGGDVIGFGSRAGNDVLIYAFLSHNGTITDLGTVEGDNSSNAFGINNKRRSSGAKLVF